MPVAGDQAQPARARRSFGAIEDGVEHAWILPACGTRFEAGGSARTARTATQESAATALAVLRPQGQHQPAARAGGAQPHGANRGSATAATLRAAVTEATRRTGTRGPRPGDGHAPPKRRRGPDVSGEPKLTLGSVTRDSSPRENVDGAGDPRPSDRSEPQPYSSTATIRGGRRSRRFGASTPTQDGSASVANGAQRAPSARSRPAR